MYFKNLVELLEFIFFFIQNNTGETSNIQIHPKYAYGEVGLTPSIPPNATLFIEIQLIDFWKRPIWIKPWIQQPGLSQKPYTDEEYDGS